jgi:hypothetical protein
MRNANMKPSASDRDGYNNQLNAWIQRVKLYAFYIMVPSCGSFWALPFINDSATRITFLWSWAFVTATAIVTNQALLATLKSHSKGVITALKVIITFGTVIVLGFCTFSILSVVAWLLS